MNIKQHIPNLLTLANLACGVLAILSFSNNINSIYQNDDNLIVGINLIFLATIFDFLDGFAARLLKVQSEIGAQLDSLADLVTFGVAPGIMIYSILNSSKIFIDSSELYLINQEIFLSEKIILQDYLKYLSVLIPVFSAYRLAKFNVDTEQTTFFKGLATPANAIFWCGTVLAFFIADEGRLNGYIYYMLILILSILMVTNLKMFSLKIKNFKLEGDNVYRLIFLFGILVMLMSTFLLGNILYSISGIILLYILLSIPYHLSKNKTT